jgi:hypothetical protein
MAQLHSTHCSAAVGTYLLITADVQAAAMKQSHCYITSLAIAYRNIQFSQLAAVHDKKMSTQTCLSCSTTSMEAQLALCYTTVATITKRQQYC